MGFDHLFISIFTTWRYRVVGLFRSLKDLSIMSCIGNLFCDLRDIGLSPVINDLQFMGFKIPLWSSKMVYKGGRARQC